MKLWKEIRKKWQKSSRTRSIVQYLCFVIIAAVFWGFLTFNNNVKVEVEVPVKLVLPDNIHLLSKVPDTLTVTLSDRGYKFIADLFKKRPTLNLRFTDYSDGTNTFKIDQDHLKKALAPLFNKRANIVSVLPESINVKYTDLPGKKVPIKADIIVEPHLDYTQYGTLIFSQDSVLVFSDAETLSKIDEVYTYHVKELDLTDTLRRRVTIAPIKGAVTEPRSIEVVVPIEELVKLKRNVKISVRNAPSDVKMLLFPSNVDITFRSPKSCIKQAESITAIVDYNEVNVASPGNKVRVNVGEVPMAFKDPMLSPDSVEYIIEKSR